MDIDIEALGLKSFYNFKETCIPTSREISDIHQKLRQIVTPTIIELESKKLINGFHYLIHHDIDLRLSCNDWNRHESSIKKILAEHSVATELTNWAMPPETSGGEIGVFLCYNNLEFNSRLSLALIGLINKTSDKSIRQAQENLCPHQWVHYLCNQFGYLNLDQIRFEFNDAFRWLELMVSSYKEDVEMISFEKDTISELRRFANQLENNLKEHDLENTNS